MRRDPDTGEQKQIQVRMDTCPACAFGPAITSQHEALERAKDEYVAGDGDVSLLEDRVESIAGHDPIHAGDKLT